MRKFIIAFAGLALITFLCGQSVMVPGPGLSVGTGITPIGTPTSFGSKVVSGTAPGATVTFTTTANLAAGNMAICIFAQGSNGSQTISSISDGTNSYSNAFAVGTAGTNGELELWYVSNVTAVLSGATLTVTMSAAGGGSNSGTNLYCYQLAGIISGAPLDKTATSTVNTTTPSVATGTLIQANEIVFGATFNWNGSSPSYTESSGFTNLLSPPAGIGVAVGIGYKIVTATTSATFAPTWGTTAAVGMNTGAASFKGH